MLFWARAFSPPPCHHLPRFLLSAALQLGCPRPAKHLGKAFCHGNQDGQLGVVKDSSYRPTCQSGFPGLSRPFLPLVGSTECQDRMMGEGEGPYLVWLWLRCSTCRPLRPRRPHGMACSWLWSSSSSVREA